MPPPILVRITRAVVLLSVAATAATACTAVLARPGAGPARAETAVPWRASRTAASDPPAALTRAPSPAVSVLASTAPEALAATFAERLFGSAPVVVVAAGTAAVLPAVQADALAAHAPLLLSGTEPGAPVLAAIKSLHPRAVLAVGVPAAALAARLPGVHVVSRAALLPKTAAAAPLTGVAVLVRRAAAGQTAGPSAGQTAGQAAGPSAGQGADTTAGQAAGVAAVMTTAAVAGAAVVTVAGFDPRADPAAIRTLARLRPREVVAVGSGFGPASRLAARVAVAATGTQLPGGGQVLFPGHRLVALYGHPGTAALGVLGQQDLAASITRAQKVAAMYRPLSRVPVIPAFEIIATVAEASGGADGMYSYQTPVSLLAQWVRRATAAGMYVILDLQPGRASLLAQAKVYRSLLEQPDVGLALDPEWKLQPGQLPLRQIGSVSITEVNAVVRWLAALTARRHLPQKLLVLHQFRLSMISGERHLDTGNDDLAIVIHMDGQGTPAMKLQTWDAVTAAAPPGVFFGWKNFTVKDHPMLTPGETMANTPKPVMISYQ